MTRLFASSYYLPISEIGSFGVMWSNTKTVPSLYGVCANPSEGQKSFKWISIIQVFVSTWGWRSELKCYMDTKSNESLIIICIGWALKKLIKRP